MKTSAGWVSIYEDKEHNSFHGQWHADKDAPFAAAANRISCQEVFVDTPEYEECEEIVGWVNVYQRESGTLRSSLVHDTEEQCNQERTHWDGERFLSCQPIRVTVKREKKRPVERSVVIPCIKWNRYEGIVFPVHQQQDDMPNVHSLYGKTGTLTFTWTEDPTT